MTATESTTVTVAYGDGIGPEIMEAVLSILRYARAKISIETIEIGQKQYEKGYLSGFSPSAEETLKRNRIILKSPITTPQGKGYKSLNVTMRSALGLYANIRPCIACSPYVPTHHPLLNLVIVRENEEDLYTGIEYRQTQEVYESLKLVSRSGCERIVRYAFEYAKLNNRQKVSCFSKDNIMKMTGGLFHNVFNEVAKEYPEIATNHYIIDIGSAHLATHPERFDVIVTSNLYGDIISDIAAEVSGSVGMAGSANIGEYYAMFEAIHGSAPDIAGKNIANPSGLLHAAIMMLVHLNQVDTASMIHNAWLCTLEEGIHTADIFKVEHSVEKVGTQEFAQAVIKRLGRLPRKLIPVLYKSRKTEITVPQSSSVSAQKKEEKRLVGVDVFLDWVGEGQSISDIPEALATKIQPLASGPLALQMITALGLKVWPHKDILPHASDHWRLRFVPTRAEKTTTHAEIGALLLRLAEAGFDFIKTENLYTFGDKLGFSLAQGE